MGSVLGNDMIFENCHVSCCTQNLCNDAQSTVGTETTQLPVINNITLEAVTTKMTTVMRTVTSAIHTTSSSTDLGGKWTS